MPPPDLSATATWEAALARTKQSYDETPYVSVPLQRQHPGGLEAAARWRGVAASPARAARVLEIGCASGGHIIPLAAAMPQARFHGVDISPVQIAQGQARIDRLGLSNIQLTERGLSEIGVDDGLFDYIICHGVYSWISEPLRRDLLRVVWERLSPEGVAVISFNVLPGWRLFQIARDSLLLHARLQNNPAERAAQARELFAMLGEQSREGQSYGRFWRDEAKRIAAGGDAYIAHEMFEEANHPLDFTAFSAALKDFGLAYLGESVPSANVEDCLAPEGAESIRALAQGEDRAREQYIDIFSGRTFREALIVRADRAEHMRRQPPPDQLDEFHFILMRGVKARAVEGEALAWRIGEGEDGLIVYGADVVQAIERMIARQPRSSRLEDVAPADASDPAFREQVALALIGLVQFGQCLISSVPVDCANCLDERPRAWRLAASDAIQGSMTANLRHAPIQLTPFQRVLLPLLDGTKTRDDLVAHLAEQAEQGAFRVDGPGGRIEGRDHLTARLGPATDDCLAALLRFAMLEGPSGFGRE